MQTLIISAGEAGQRFDKFLGKYFRDASAGFLYKMLRKKNITLNGRKAAGSEILKEADEIAVFMSDETIRKFRGVSVRTEEPGTFVPDVLFRSRDILVLNKPAGMLVQPGNTSEPSVADHLPGWMLEHGYLSEEELRAFRPAPANRIDRNTSGIVLCGTSYAGLRVLSEIIRNGALKKSYFVLTAKTDLKDGVYTAWARKKAAGNMMEVKDAPEPGYARMVTGLTAVCHGRSLSLLRIELITGRTHQIRAHLGHLGAFVAGDRKYGSAPLNRKLASAYGVNRQLLHACEAVFPPEAAEKCEFPPGGRVRAPLPGDFLRVLKGEGMIIPEGFAHPGA